MLLHRILGIILVVWTITACNKIDEGVSKKLVIGVVSYGESSRSLEQYSDLQNYLSIQLKSIVELEPAYNEIHALEQIAKKKWDLVFASPGLAAIAIYRHQYKPMIPLEGIETLRSLIVVNADSRFQDHKDLGGEIVALGQEGSATGYYLPIYNLYGLTLAEVRFAPTPQTSLEWLDQGEVAAAALSLQEFNQYRNNFKPNRFRIINIDSRNIPSGAIVIVDKIDPEQKQKIQSVLSQAPSHIAASAKFLPSEEFSQEQYEYLIKVIKRVLPIAERIKDKPALLYESKKSVVK